MKVIHSQSLLSEKFPCTGASWNSLSRPLFLLPESLVMTAVKEWNPFFHEKRLS